MSGFDESSIRSLLEADRFAGGLGVTLVSVDDDQITVGLDVRAEHTNFLEVGHGGVVFSLADVALSLASNSGGQTALAIDAHVALTAPVRPGDRLLAAIRNVARARTLETYRVDITRGDGRAVGTFTGTVYLPPSRSVPD